VVVCLSSKREALSSNPRTTKERGRGRRKEKEEGRRRRRRRKKRRRKKVLQFIQTQNFVNPWTGGVAQMVEPNMLKAQGCKTKTKNKQALLKMLALYYCHS
jgi:hypothetical protein